MTSTRWARTAAIALALAATMPSLASTAGAQSSSQSSEPLQARTATAKAALATQPVDPASGAVIVKFREGSGVRLQGSALTAPVDLAGVHAVLATFPGITVERLFDRPVADLAREKARVEARTRRQLADLNLYFRLVVPEGTDVAALVAELNKLEVVEGAYSEPTAAPPPVTPDFTAQQGYRLTAPGGIGANLVSAVAGGKGQNIVIADIEYSWNVDHEDLAKARAAGAVIANGTPDDPFSDFNHGTAVLGEIVGDENAFGVTGIVSGATLRLVNANTTGGYDLANAISLATAALAPGDVILIEQQTTGPTAGATRRPRSGALRSSGCRPSTTPSSSPPPPGSSSSRRPAMAPRTSTPPPTTRSTPGPTPAPSWSVRGAPRDVPRRREDGSTSPTPAPASTSRAGASVW